jgi:2'-5' RNA ligase
VYSCNVPVPTEVARLARGLAADCIEATPRDRHTLVVKRLGEDRPEELARRIRRTLEGVPPFEVRTAGVELFREPETGSDPVAYLRIESPALLELHERLCAVADPIAGLEGDDYVPHVTVARGGDAARLVGAETGGTITWTVDSLLVWAGPYGEPTARISLPA